MSYNSPLAHPEPYITKLNDLSQEGITIDQGVDRGRREAAEFAAKYSANFTIVLELRESTDEFSAVRAFFHIIILTVRLKINLALDQSVVDDPRCCFCYCSLVPMSDLFLILEIRTLI